ncbi:lanthionine synthetase C family protein [Paenibacillus sp. DCT19]|uniref:lanthionine synthetase C family protein n=1 Tax=Paenibacillus sp. DCT19 TaxID=2211212 RepID=UPI000FE26F76|nr:lanthionine synthetase C family protein [Paenibacillus sp. DCT19]
MHKLDQKKDVIDNLITNLAKKMSNVEYVQSILDSKTIEYKSTSVAVSYPALCILFSELELNFPNCDFDTVAHKYLEIVNYYLEKNNTSDISLFDGLCGVGFAAHCMSNNGERYQSFIENLNKYIVSIADRNISEYKRIPFNEFSYDIMYGLAGTANYLMNFKSETQVKDTLMSILQYLTNICKIDESGIPKFAIRSDHSQLFHLANDPKVMYVNLGVSHGIPGVLLVLSKSYESGVYFEEQLEAIKCLSNYISKSFVNKGDDFFWETQRLIGTDGVKALQSRDAWCYGTPGVAYSLLIASRILNDNKMRNLAIHSMKLSLKRLREVVSPTFCHGISGICSLTRKFYEYTGDIYFQELYMEMFENILNVYSDKNPLGFKDTEFEKGKLVDKDEIGLLNGTSGVILTLLSCYRPVKTQWDSIFLL